MPKIDYNKIIENKSEKEFYQKQHDKILKYLDTVDMASFWDILRYVGGSDRRMLRLINQMIKNVEIKTDGHYIEAKEKKIGWQRIVCRECYGKIIPNNTSFSLKEGMLKEICEKKPSPTFLFDQRPVTVSTSFRRAVYLYWRGDLQDKDIVLIGDDDLTSIALALLKKAKSIIVFEVDKRLVKFINKTAKENSLNVTAYQYDLTKNIPKSFYRKFDVFLTDPTPNKEAFSFFVSIGLKLLKEGEGKVGYVSFFPSHSNISIDFQKALTDFNVIITEMIPRFTEYAWLKETYGKEDLKMLKQFDTNEKFSFHENFTRFETTKETVKEIYKIKSEITGKATKRILKNIKKDPAYQNGDKEFVLQTARGWGDS